MGYETTIKTDSIDALNLFKASPDMFDLVITDMTMPGMTGDILSKKMLAIKPDIPIVLCTGFSAIITPEDAEKIGIKGFLKKPVVMLELANTIYDILK